MDRKAQSKPAKGKTIRIVKPFPEEDGYGRMTDKVRNYVGKIVETIVQDSKEEAPHPEQTMFLVEYPDRNGSTERLTKKEVEQYQSVAPDAQGLLGYHFGSFDIQENFTQDSIDSDWDTFMEDLQSTPDLASAGGSGWNALQFALLTKDVPVRVIEELLRIHPGALDYEEDDVGWNTLNLTISSYKNSGDCKALRELSPKILNLLLKTRPTLADQVEESYFEYPVVSFLDKEDTDASFFSDQAKVILQASPISVAWLLTRHSNGLIEQHNPEKARRKGLSGGFILPNEDMVEYLISCAEQHVSDYGSVDLLYDYFGNTSLNFLNVLFDGLDDSNANFFHRCMKMAAVFEEERCELENLPQLDLDSVTCCVLYALLGVGDDVDDDESEPSAVATHLQWHSFLEQFSDIVGNPLADGSSSLFTAIRLGYDWDPYLKGILDANEAALTEIDPQLGLPPFVVAAIVDDHEDDARNATLVYELLRRNPAAANVGRLQLSKQQPGGKKKGHGGKRKMLATRWIRMQEARRN